MVANRESYLGGNESDGQLVTRCPPLDFVSDEQQHLSGEPQALHDVYRRGDCGNVGAASAVAEAIRQDTKHLVAESGYTRGLECLKAITLDDQRPN